MKPYYEHAGVTIYHGDAWEIVPTLEIPIALVCSDPPYGSGLAVDFAERFKTKAGKWWNCDDRNGQARHIPIHGDDGPFDPSLLLSIKSKAKVLWGGNWYASRLSDRGGWWIWDKRGGKRDVSEADWPLSEAELAWTDVGKGTRIFRYTWFGLIRDGDHGEHYHPTQKPTALMKWCIEMSKTDGLVIDPYMGSGTTLVAAKALNRPVIGIELEEKYCEIAAKRLAQEVMDFASNPAEVL
jgi:site-specific DNA-methyltransferase (adenine-specific)